VRWFQTKQCCGADETLQTAVMVVKRGRPQVPKRSQMVWHKRGELRYWHWKDQEVIKI